LSSTQGEALGLRISQAEAGRRDTGVNGVNSLRELIFHKMPSVMSSFENFHGGGVNTSKIWCEPMSKMSPSVSPKQARHPTYCNLTMPPSAQPYSAIETSTVSMHRLLFEKPHRQSRARCNPTSVRCESATRLNCSGPSETLLIILAHC
jgi:hypothetical protein